jgi:hypothetical protein
MKLFLPFALVAALALGACVTKPLLPPSAQTVTYQGTASVEVSFDVGRQLFVKYGARLSPANHAKAVALIKEISGAIDTAEAAETLGDDVTVAAQVQDAGALIAQLRGLLPTK